MLKQGSNNSSNSHNGSIKSTEYTKFRQDYQLYFNRLNPWILPRGSTQGRLRFLFVLLPKVPMKWSLDSSYLSPLAHFSKYWFSYNWTSVSRQLRDSWSSPMLGIELLVVCINARIVYTKTTITVRIISVEFHLQCYF